MIRSIEPMLSPFERYTLVPSTLSLPISVEVSRRSIVCVAISSSCALRLPLASTGARDGCSSPGEPCEPCHVGFSSNYRGRIAMPRGDKSKYTGRQKRKAEHIEDSYEKRG